MKKLSFGFLAVSLVSLVACSSQSTTKYSLSFNVSDTQMQQSLTEASVRVIQRRVDHLGLTLVNGTVQSLSGSTTITVIVSEEMGLDMLTDELVQPFDMKVMRTAKEGETADITVEGHGGFKDAGIDQSDLLWVDSRADEEGKGEVRLVFTEPGRAKLATLFKQVNGQDIGLFVRDKLVSKLHVGTDVVPQDVVIRGIPTAEVAQVFADDMNVGLHVTFTPVP